MSHPTDSLTTPAPDPGADTPTLGSQVWTQPDFDPATPAPAAQTPPVGGPGSSPGQAAFPLLPTPSALPEGVVTGPYWRRMAATAVHVVVGMVGVFLYLVAVQPGRNYWNASGFSMGWEGGFEPLFVFAVVAALANVLPAAAFGASLGHLLTGLRIVDPATTARKGAVQAAVRSGVIVLMFLLCLVPGLICLASPLWGGPLRQGWADKAAGVAVVTADSVGELQ